MLPKYPAKAPGTRVSLNKMGYLLGGRRPSICVRPTLPRALKYHYSGFARSAQKGPEAMKDRGESLFCGCTPQAFKGNGALLMLHCFQGAQMLELSWLLKNLKKPKGKLSHNLLFVNFLTKMFLCQLRKHLTSDKSIFIDAGYIWPPGLIYCNEDQ